MKVHMLKISFVEDRTRYKLILEGKLIAPWAAELRTVCEKARADLGSRELVIDMKHLTVISQEGENLLFELMNEGVKFRCQGVLAKQVLKQVAHRQARNL
jgi:hypothetical protein